MNYLTRIETLHPDILDDFMITGRSEAIPEELQIYIKQIQWSAEIWESERNITRAAKKLRQRIFSAQMIPIALNTCKSRIQDAMLYFNIDLNVPQKIWDLDTANKLEDLAKITIAEGNYKEARLNYLKSNELRRRAASAISSDDLKAPVFLFSTELTAEDLGFEKKNLKEIATKHNEGFYIKMISSLPIEKGEKRSLLNDADIEDADYEEIDE